jgi:hypothetical protein
VSSFSVSTIQAPLALWERVGVRESQTVPTASNRKEPQRIETKPGAALRGRSLTPAPLPEGEGIRIARPDAKRLEMGLFAGKADTLNHEKRPGNNSPALLYFSPRYGFFGFFLVLGFFLS